ncbi:MAG: hypothetical protein JJU10_07175 [Idiomarina sp.]|nr:hypothetical protein [Idiomarina sp.]
MMTLDTSQAIASQALASQTVGTTVPRGNVNPITAQSRNEDRQPEALPRRSTRVADLAAAAEQRAALTYDEPAGDSRRAVSQYQDVATFAKRDSLQQMVGIDIYA